MFIELLSLACIKQDRARSAHVGIRAKLEGRQTSANNYSHLSNNSSCAKCSERERHGVMRSFKKGTQPGQKVEID